MATLFISDLHLDPSRPAISECLLRFLTGIQGGARALYILGDLFETWVGDDHPEPAYQPVKQALKNCNLAGTPVFLLPGNRDFLLGEQFSLETGCTLLEDPSTIDLYGSRALLMHGDALCTDDTDYQALRRRVRDPEWQQQALSLPLDERLQLAEQARELSTLSTQGKSETIMDVNQEEVWRAFDCHNACLLIHGHTHRPGIYDCVHRGKNLRRIVLGDWYRQGSVLSADAGGFELKTLPV
jgi:UDP-2,3-diacylglucosamine hydrolase